MKLLIIGGTIFLGRHLVEAALASGHDVTLFHRGRHNPGLFPDVETITGDRTVPADLAQLTAADRHFDAVIDTCGYVPRIVRLSTEALADRVGTYCFISSISAFRDFTQPGMNEDAPLGVLEDPAVETVTGETYGPLKVACESVVTEAFPDHSLIIRPGLIVGPHDPSDRFTYWPHRIARGGDVLAPDRPDVPIQFIDARDLAEWTIRLLKAKVTGTFNATGPDSRLTIGDLLNACLRVSGINAHLIWASESFLEAQGIGQWMELPVWVSDRESPGFATIDISRAVAAGLTFRPLDTTVADTLDWERTRSVDHVWGAGLTAEREAAALAVLAE